MNPLHYECPRCQAIISGDASLHGQRVQCEKCQATFLVPAQFAHVATPTARLIAGPAARVIPPTVGAAEETEIFTLSPVARSFVGQIMLGAIFLGLAVGLAVTRQSNAESRGSKAKPQGESVFWEESRVPVHGGSISQRSTLNSQLHPSGFKPEAQGFTWAPWAALGALVVGLLLLLSVWIKVKSCSYRLTTQRLFVRRGWLAKRLEELELYRVKDVLVDQGIWERLLGYGTITVIADDDTTPQLNLPRISNPVEIKERIRTQFRAARQREGVRPTELMHSP